MESFQAQMTYMYGRSLFNDIHPHCLISNREGLGTRKSTLRFTTSSSLVLIRLVLTEIQPFENVKINKEMYGHPEAVFGQHIGSIYTKLGDFVKLGLHFMTIWINSC